MAGMHLPPCPGAILCYALPLVAVKAPGDTCSLAAPRDDAVMPTRSLAGMSETEYSSLLAKAVHHQHTHGYIARIILPGPSEN